jgi:hypothetical protein
MRQALVTLLKLAQCRGPFWFRVWWGRFVFLVAPKQPCPCGAGYSVPRDPECGGWAEANMARFHCAGGCSE